MSRAEIAFDDLTHAFGPLPVFAGLSGRVGAGEILAVSGPNGSGKSTLLRCLAGLLRPLRGEVRLAAEGGELDEPARRRAVGYVAPEVAFYGELTAAENLAFFARLRGLPAAGGLGLLERFGVPPGRPVAHLSSGMLQRLRWAWALLHRPPVLLLDEPFQNVDPRGRRALSAALEEHLATGAAVVADPEAFSHPHVASHLALDS